MKAVLPKTLLCLALGAALAAEAAPTLVDNVHGYTLSNGKLTEFSGLVFDAGKVLAVGDAGALKAKHPDAQRIDGQGRVLLPGLIDAHGHVFRQGFARVELNLAGSRSLQQAQAALAAYAKANPDQAWLRGRGWNQVVWQLGRFPTAAELDAIVADRPVWLVRVDAHAGWANTKALALAGITRDTPDPLGGRIERDQDGNPTGVLVDRAMDHIRKVLPAYGDDDKRKALEAALQHFAALGLTSVHDAGIDASEYRIYREFADAGKLTTRVYAMVRDTGDDFRTISKDGPLSAYADDRLSVRSVKLVADGALGSRGAALLEPYTDAPDHKGLLFVDADTMRAKIERGLAAGYQVNVHAIGDAANRQVLDAFEAVYRNVGKGREQRNRIEHAQVLALADIPRLEALGLVASMQPTHATSDMNMAEDRVGPERIKGAYAWKTILSQGTVIAAGSDFPVESANPFYGLHAAVTRTDHEGKPIGGWHPEEAMTLAQAFRAFTLDAAWAAHQDKTLGSLEPGKWADFVLVDQDIFTIQPGGIWKTRVLETWVAGERVYRTGG